jgi:membrane-bound inhibitor of C-type lysozyme
VIINKKVIVLILIIALGVITWMYFSNSGIVGRSNENVFFFSCPDGVEIKIIYGQDAESALLSIKGKEYKLNQAISASGARYANEDETVIFWEHQGEAMVEMDGEIIYQGCSLKE